jgi:hypothetical protein
VFYGHYLGVNAQEDDFLRVIGNAELIFDVFHDIIYMKELLGFDLLGFEINFKAPKTEALSFLFFLFKENVDNVVY